MSSPAGVRSPWVLRGLWIVLTAALLVALPRLPWGLAAREIAATDPRWLVLAALAFGAILPLWALEWLLLAPGPRRAFRIMVEIVVVTAAVLNSVPMLAGELSGVALLVSRAGLARGAAISVLALDQLLVAFAKLVVLVAAAMAVGIPAWLRAGLLSLLVVFVLASVALSALAHGGQRWAGTWARHESAWRRIASRVIAWGVHLEALRDPRRAAAVAALALVKKAAELAGVVAIQLAFGLEPSLAIALLVVASLAISTLVPVAPANVGVYEATVYGVYRYAGVAPELALGIAVVQHVTFLLPSLLPGYLVLTLRQLAPARKPVA